MITNGFTYIAVLVFLAAVLVGAEKLTKWKFFKFVPPVVLLYLLTMLLCTVGAWDGALVPVGVLMALMGYMIGTGGGILTANIMRLFA